MPLVKYVGSWLDGERSDRNRVKSMRREDIKTRNPRDSTVCLCRQLLGADKKMHQSLVVECEGS